MEAIKEKITELNHLIYSGKALEAFEKFYHDEVVMQENESKPTFGKEANRQREQEFFDNMIEFRAKPIDVTTGENVSMVTWHFDYTHKQWGERNFKQVSVQHWLDGKIIKEQFFYGN